MQLSLCKHLFWLLFFSASLYSCSSDESTTAPQDSESNSSSTLSSSSTTVFVDYQSCFTLQNQLIDSSSFSEYSPDTTKYGVTNNHIAWAPPTSHEYCDPDWWEYFKNFTLSTFNDSTTNTIQLTNSQSLNANSTTYCSQPQNQFIFEISQTILSNTHTNIILHDSTTNLTYNYSHNVGRVISSNFSIITFSNDTIIESQSGCESINSNR